MKKLLLTLAIVLGMGMTSFATNEDYYEEGGGLFGLGSKYFDFGNRDGEDDESLLLPYQHGLDEDFDADAPLGSGIVALIGFGAAYLVGKKRKEE